MSTINLLPSDYLRRQQENRVHVGFLVLFAIVMVTVLSAVLVSKQRLANIGSVLKQVDADYADAAKMIDQVQQLEAQKRQMQAKADIAASLLERTPRSTVLAVIGQARPEHTMLTQVDLYTKRIVLAAPKPQSKVAKIQAQRKQTGEAEEPKQVILTVNLEILGWAQTDLQVARFIAALGQSDLAERVELAYSKELKSDEGVVREFKINLELNPNANAIEIARLARLRGKAPTPASLLIRVLLGAES